MKLHFNAPKPLRVTNCFVGYFMYDPLCKDDWMWNETLKQWEIGTEKEDCYYSTHASCKSVKAFRRALKKAPAGVKFTLVHWGFPQFDVDFVNTSFDVIIHLLIEMSVATSFFECFDSKENGCAP